MNKSLILSVAGAAGVIFTALAASKATLKAEKKLSDISDAELTKFENTRIEGMTVSLNGRSYSGLVLPVANLRKLMGVEGVEDVAVSLHPAFS